MSDEMTPITRAEKYLDVLLKGGEVGMKPLTRIEKYLAALLEKGVGDSGSAPPDWNAAEGEPGHILNRPFGEEQAFEPITWDGNTEGLEYVREGFDFYKVSDTFIEANDALEQATIELTIRAPALGMEQSSIVSLGNIMRYSYGWVSGVKNGDLSAQVLCFDGTLPFDDGVLSRGVWLEKKIMQSEGVTAEIYISAITPPTTITPIPEKYLPESVDSVVIRSSTADSTKKFKLTVDDNGAITATEVT